MRSDAADSPVVIVGGGFSGTMTAVQLARRGICTVLVDGSGRMNRGVAYSTTEAVHLLNVPSGKMSAWPDAPDDFARRLGNDGSGFAERRQFGRYLDGIAAEHEELIEKRSDTATRVEQAGNGWTVRLGSGALLRCRALVLANGNQTPAPMAVAEGLPSDLFVNNPWGNAAKDAVARVAESGADVLILGAGLTMIDTVLSLDAAGHRGRITALSRRGLVPRAHAPFEPASLDAGEVPFGAVLPLWRWLRQRSGEVGFRAAVDSLRPHSQAIWRSLQNAEQRRFLRHARPWWDVHRHRIAPEISSRLEELIAEGRLGVVAGRVRSLAADNGELVAEITRRGSGHQEQRRVSCAFNCTGPLGEMRRTADPLLRQLIADEQVSIDPLGIGFAVDERSRAGKRLWAVGPLTKGCYWEIVAVPDIRGQAAAVAEDIAVELGA